MFERNYADGDQIYAQGDPGDAVFIVLKGRVELRRTDDPASVRIVPAGKAFGRTEVVRGRARQYSAFAVGDVALGLFRRIEVLEQLERTPDLWFPAVIQALQRHPPAGPVPFIDIETFPPPQEKTTVPKAELVLMADGGKAAAQIDGDGIPIRKLPYRVGRSTKRSHRPVVGVDLTLKDQAPFALSRRHFVIDAAPDRRFVVRDDGSHHGTVVNGQRLGRDGAGRTAFLHEGDNEIVAGSGESEFRFLLRISPD